MAIKHAIFDQERSFESNKQNLNHLVNSCSNITQFPPFDISQIEPIYSINKQLIQAIETYYNIKDKLVNETYPQLARFNEQLDATTTKLNEYAHYSVTSTFTYQDFEYRGNEYRTVCSKCDKNETKSCHNPCNCVKFGGNIKLCSIFRGGNVRRCNICSHSVRYHCHSRQFPITKEKIQVNVNENMKSAYFDAQMEIRDLSLNIKKLKSLEIIPAKGQLFELLRRMVNLVCELKKYNPMMMYNNVINEYMQQCITGMTKDEQTNYASTAAVKTNENGTSKDDNDDNDHENKNDSDNLDIKAKLEEIDKYQKWKMIYSMKNDIVRLFEENNNKNKNENGNDDDNKNENENEKKNDKENLSETMNKYNKIHREILVSLIDENYGIDGIGRRYMELFLEKQFGKHYRYGSGTVSRNDDVSIPRNMKDWNDFCCNIGQTCSIATSLLSYFYINSKSNKKEDNNNNNNKTESKTEDEKETDEKDKNAFNCLYLKLNMTDFIVSAKNYNEKIYTGGDNIAHNCIIASRCIQVS